jgi:hypothetical protein
MHLNQQASADYKSMVNIWFPALAHLQKEQSYYIKFIESVPKMRLIASYYMLS